MNVAKPSEKSNLQVTDEAERVPGDVGRLVRGHPQQEGEQPLGGRRVVPHEGLLRVGAPEVGEGHLHPRRPDQVSGSNVNHCF